MLWVLKRTVSMRRFFWAPKTYVKTEGQENIFTFTLKNCVYLNLWDIHARWMSIRSASNIKEWIPDLSLLHMIVL